MACNNLNSIQNLISGGGGTSVSFGLESEIPFVNDSSSDFDYDNTFVFSGGQLGVGTDTPTAKVEIVSDVATDSLILRNSDNVISFRVADSGDAYFEPNSLTFLGYRAYAGGVLMCQKSGTGLLFSSFSSSFTNLRASGGAELNLRGGGVGINIGLAVPDANLHLNGTLKLENLPTSSAGLLAGDVWNDAGTLKIV